MASRGKASKEAKETTTRDPVVITKDPAAFKRGVADAIVKAVNEQRKKNGLPPLPKG